MSSGQGQPELIDSLFDDRRVLPRDARVLFLFDAFKRDITAEVVPIESYPRRVSAGFNEIWE